MKSILIVKTSAIGDVVQTFGVVEYLRQKFPHAQIDWVVEKASSSLLLAHPYLNEVKILDSKSWRKAPLSKKVRREMQSFAEGLQNKVYDVLFDLQGNTKSGLIDFFCKAEKKVGFAKDSVAEKPNLLFTDHKIEKGSSVSVYQNYLQLVQSYFGDTDPFHPKGIRLKISEAEQERLKTVLSHRHLQKRRLFMIALGSNWENKRISEETASSFLSLIASDPEIGFLIVYSNSVEKQKAEELSRSLPSHCVTIGEMSLPFWQALMAEMNGVISMDSAALHLAATAGAPTFSMFGASSALAYKPEGPHHHAVQGSCPYGKTFTKRCPILRTCKTGACIKDLKSHLLYEEFNRWYEHLPGEVSSQSQYEILQPQSLL